MSGDVWETNEKNEARDGQAAGVRMACADDGPAVSAILAEAFPELYQAAFGVSKQRQTERLLTALYRAGCLSLATTLVAERGGQVIGVAIMHRGDPIGRGTARHYAGVLRRELGAFHAPSAFLRGLALNALLTRRIPHAPDLLYIEALAVSAQARAGGVGTRLLHEAETWARAQGCRRLALHVVERNTGARRLYERLGFALPERSPARGPRLPFRRASSGWHAHLLYKTLVPAEPSF